MSKTILPFHGTSELKLKKNTGRTECTQHPQLHTERPPSQICLNGHILVSESLSLLIVSCLILIYDTTKALNNLASKNIHVSHTGTNRKLGN